MRGAAERAANQRVADDPAHPRPVRCQDNSRTMCGFACARYVLNAAAEWDVGICTAHTPAPACACRRTAPHQRSTACSARALAAGAGSHSANSRRPLAQSWKQLRAEPDERWPTQVCVDLQGPL